MKNLQYLAFVLCIKIIPQAYLARIEEVNLNGPRLRAVLETNTKAVQYAEELDEERMTTGKRGLLHGIPVLLKVYLSN